MMSKDLEFSMVSTLRSSLAGVCKELSKQTAADYARIYQRLATLGEGPEDAGSRSEYYCRRAALIYVCSIQARKALSARDKAERGSPEWVAAMAEIQRIISIFERYPPDPGRKHQTNGTPGVSWCDVRRQKEAAGWRPSFKSKRIGLDALVRRPGWQEALLEHISPIHRDALAVALLTGARPAEIAAGVTVKNAPEGLLITIKGAKVNHHRGQPSRMLLVAPDSAAARHLASLAGEGEVTVTTSPKRLSDAVTQAGRRAFPRMRTNISPYSLRHAIASSLKASGIDPEGIAMVLGHRCTKSAQVYGRSCHGQRTSILGVHASVPVKITGTDPAAIGRRRAPSPRLR